MRIKIRCPKCRRKHRVRKEYAGKKIQCPDCGFVAEIPPELFEQSHSETGSITELKFDSEKLPKAAPAPPAQSRNRPELPHSVVPPPLPSAAPQPPSPPARPGTPPALPPIRGTAHVVPAHESRVDERKPYVSIASIRSPKLADIPDLGGFTRLASGEEVLRSYRIRIKRPKMLPLFILGLFVPVPILGLLVTLPIHFLRSRGHTFLYVTGKRLIIVELLDGPLGRSQAVLNFGLETIAGFEVLAQHGLHKFLQMVTVKEKRTFYISIKTRTFATFALGSENAMNSEFDPGQDAVALCSELDSLVLSIKSSDTP